MRLIKTDILKHFESYNGIDFTCDVDYDSKFETYWIHFSAQVMPIEPVNKVIYRKLNLCISTHISELDIEGIIDTLDVEVQRSFIC
jgi:hypothetical protein